MADLPSLLLVDDDQAITESFAFVLRDSFMVSAVSTREEAKRFLYTAPVLPNLALIDLGLPPTPHGPEEGFSLVSDLLAFNPSMKILILSGQDTQDNVRHALTLGAVDFIPKPCDIELLKTRLKHQVMIFDAEQYVATPVEKRECHLIGQSSAMNMLRSQIQQFANSPFSVLIQGESGSGKELVAQCLHTQSCRAVLPCLTLNCAAFTSELLEAQLFGHAKGAFTGAGTARAGFFEEAGDGSLILDEIGEMPLSLQSKLLRVLENGEYYRIGETKVRQSNARIIAASNRDLREEVQAGHFRADLYHRLSVLTIRVPPLRERGDDRLTLLEHFQQFYKEMGTLFQLDNNAKQAWMAYSFPGNIRELRNIVIRIGAKYPNQAISRSLLEMELETDINRQELADIDSEEAILRQINQGNFSLDDVLLDWERRYINAALTTSQGNLSKAARVLGINRTTLYSKMQRMGKTTPSA
ncbi:sigma-54-dependent transcriptional regulator [Beggiatoa leptomitoformis]|uniref:Response regulator n=1 Tax=Beggiatoa leptomitoformis TaxID=288004 RepID=A0A2N9YBT7_9GAMM|nr:sigma-54 dependent transcriptional regulator [Beggiatoa leptomitoformis]ALG66758.1 response regulator [Beggiatoa leptomitoformis]AUI67899.1 response regulator [Beggiatoa leptomitoformis]